jgi:YVTN family beta-propeller protein
VAGSDAVQVLDATTNTLAGEIPVGVSPHLPTFTPDGQVGLVVAQGPGELDLIDPRSKTESMAIKVGTMPHWLATSSSGHTAYVTDEVSNDVSIVDLPSHQVLATVPIGNGPRKIAVQPMPPTMSADHAPSAPAMKDDDDDY